MKKMFTILQTHVSRIVAVVTITLMGLAPQLADAQVTSPAPYCKPTFNQMGQGPCSNGWEWRLLRVRLANLDYWEPNCNAAVTSDYRFFIPPSAERALLTPGNNYTVTVNAGLGNNLTNRYAMVFIDWNKNNVFDAGEILSGIAPGTQFTATTPQNFTFDIPCGFASGTYRMRVMTSWANPFNASGACGTYNYGETWDFEVTVLPTPPVPKPDFTFPASVFVGTPMIFVNTTANKNANFSWDLDLDGTDAGSWT